MPRDISEPSLSWLDRAAIAYVMLPVTVFLAGWMNWWVALPALVATIWALHAVLVPTGSASTGVLPVWQIGLAAAVALIWTWLGGTGHFMFANSDWHTRDAVLHDLVVSPWPVGYGSMSGHETLLRTTVAYFLPAALAGKAFGLGVAQQFLYIWTALGVWLFLAQVLTLVPGRWYVVPVTLCVVVLFSGMDFVGWLLGAGTRFLHLWTIADHLEWWARDFQYSSLTTQLFWVPNHALAGWLLTGFLLRQERRTTVDALLPTLAVGLMLWSPLTGIGMLPFFLWKVLSSLRTVRFSAALLPGAWLPALLLAVPIGGYLTMSSSSVDHGTVTQLTGLGLARIAQFYVLEIGMVGLVCCAVLPSSYAVLALVVLAVLPFFHVGPSNDLVMRASIPALVVIVIQSCRALSLETTPGRKRNLQFLLSGLLIVGAVTAVGEIARAILLPSWPANSVATLIDASCGEYPPHYVARLDVGAWQDKLLKPVHPLGPGPIRPELCVNPALQLMKEGGLL